MCDTRKSLARDHNDKQTRTRAHQAHQAIITGLLGRCGCTVMAGRALREQRADHTHAPNMRNTRARARSPLFVNQALSCDATSANGLIRRRAPASTLGTAISPEKGVINSGSKARAPRTPIQCCCRCSFHAYHTHNHLPNVGMCVCVFGRPDATAYGSLYSHVRDLQ